MTTKEAAELLDLIGERAELLAQRGVRRVELGGGVAFTLADPEPDGPVAGAAVRDDDLPTDDLHDSLTHGRPPGAGATPRRERVPLLGPDQ